MQLVATGTVNVILILISAIKLIFIISQKVRINLLRIEGAVQFPHPQIDAISS